MDDDTAARALDITAMRAHFRALAQVSPQWSPVMDEALLLAEQYEALMTREHAQALKLDALATPVRDALRAHALAALEAAARALVQCTGSGQYVPRRLALLLPGVLGQRPPLDRVTLRPRLAPRQLALALEHKHIPPLRFRGRF